MGRGAREHVHYGGFDNQRERRKLPINRAEVKCPGKLATTQAGARYTLDGHREVRGRERRGKIKVRKADPLFLDLTTCPKTWDCSPLSRMRETE